MKKNDSKVIRDSGADSVVMFDFIHTVKGVIISYFISVALLFIFSIIATYSCMSNNAIDIGVNVVTALSLIICGFIAAKGVKRAGLLNGAFSGVIYAVILYVISCIVNMGCEFTFSTLTVFVMGLICGAFGGILGINTGKRRK